MLSKNIVNYWFSKSMNDTWNSIPNYIINVDTMGMFKSRLDRRMPEDG